MANQQHLELLKQGTEAWNQWRNAHRGIPTARHEMRDLRARLARLVGEEGLVLTGTRCTADAAKA